MSSHRPLAVVLSVAVSSAALSAQQPQTAGLSGITRDMACAPASPAVKPTPTLIVASGREPRKTLFGTGDALVIRGGSAQGVKAGDEFFVRRIVDDRYVGNEPGVYPVSISTAGMAQIVEAQTDFSIAVVTYGCDGISDGDYLEPYQRPQSPATQGGATADYAHPAQVIIGAERRQIGSPGQFMVIDRGSDHGLRQGQQLTVFRRTVKDGPVANIGTASIYKVQPESSVIRIDTSLDAVYVGDLVAIHR
jgi:hypothetical protein